jgi:rhodanese-related sulfurtransferase
MPEIALITPDEAGRILAETPDAVYLDVRTEEEFAAGHPPGALNVPLFLRGKEGMTPNADFLPVVQKMLPKTSPILCGCQAGPRSRKAAEMLVETGYERLSCVAGGFEGARDAEGRITAPGWKDAGLPVATGASGEGSYPGLRKKAGR